MIVQILCKMVPALPDADDLPIRTYIEEEEWRTGTPVNVEKVEGIPPLRLISISARAAEVFSNQEKAVHWLTSPNPSLNVRTKRPSIDLLFRCASFK